MSEPLWMPLYVADYLKDTRHLSTTEHGAYLLLLMHAWTHGGTLPRDEDRLARVAGLSAKEWKGSRSILLEFFQASDDGYRHKRVDQEMTRAGGLVEQRRAAGKASAEARKALRESNARSTGVATEAPRKSNQAQSQPQREEQLAAGASKSVDSRGVDDPVLLVMRAACIPRPPSAADRQQLQSWLAAGAHIQFDVIDVAAKVAAREEQRGKGIGSLKYLDVPVRESIADAQRVRAHLDDVGDRYGGKASVAG